MENENKYIFISHSHADLAKVRLVRNTFENRGYEPILFYLHSLSDENEITDLIKREIDARLWFCLCDSQNARKSRWVQSELNYVKEQGKRTLATIDLDKIGALGVAEQCRIVNLTVDSFSRANIVFLSYMKNSAVEAKKIGMTLEEFGFDVPLLHMHNQLFQGFEDNVIESNIEKCDYFFIVIGQNCAINHWVLNEWYLARQLGKIIIPIFLDKEALLNTPGELLEWSYVLWNFDNPIESVKALINVIPIGDTRPVND